MDQKYSEYEKILQKAWYVVCRHRILQLTRTGLPSRAAISIVYQEHLDRCSKVRELKAINAELDENSDLNLKMSEYMGIRRRTKTYRSFNEEQL